MKRTLSTVALMVLAFVAGVWAYENYNIGGDTVAGISDFVNSVGSPQIASVESAKAELREIEQERNTEATRIIDTLNNNAFVPLESELGRKLQRRACDVSRSVRRQDKRMLELMRSIDKANAPDSTRVPFSAEGALLAGATTVSLVTVYGSKVVTADELEERIAKAEWEADIVC